MKDKKTNEFFSRYIKRDSANLFLGSLIGVLVSIFYELVDFIKLYKVYSSPDSLDYLIYISYLDTTISSFDYDKYFFCIKEIVMLIVLVLLFILYKIALNNEN